LVITDIRMPEMDGNAVARHIRGSTESETPIVAITGFSHEADAQLFDFMFMKPFSLEALFKSIELFV
jgi:CheY-like chemotaxis protein